MFPDIASCVSPRAETLTGSPLTQQRPPTPVGGLFSFGRRVDWANLFPIRLDERMPMPHKGPRDQFIVRTTPNVGKAIRKEAAERGICHSDVCAEILSAHYGLPAYNDAVKPAPLFQYRQALVDLDLPETG